MNQVALFILLEDHGMMSYVVDVVAKPMYDIYADMFLNPAPEQWDVAEVCNTGDRGELLQQAFIPLGEMHTPATAEYAPIDHAQIVVTRKKENYVQRFLCVSIQNQKEVSIELMKPEDIPPSAIDSLQYPGDFFWSKTQDSDKCLWVRVF